jgi:hypothetical protein
MAGRRQLALGALLAVTVAPVAAWERFRFPNFQNRPRLNLNGDAMSELGDLVLTKPSEGEYLGGRIMRRPPRGTTDPSTRSRHRL